LILSHVRSRTVSGTAGDTRPGRTTCRAQVGRAQVVSDQSVPPVST
jgi:hypothetical protein